MSGSIIIHTIEVIFIRMKFIRRSTKDRLKNPKIQETNDIGQTDRDFSKWYTPPQAKFLRTPCLSQPKLNHNI